MVLSRFFLTLLLAAANMTISFNAIAADGISVDGDWDVMLSCPAVRDDDDNAGGYVHRFTAHVKDRVLRGTHGEEGQPNWHLLTGTIAADGRAELKLEGIVANPKNAVNNAYRGKPYSYRVRASFSATAGTGQRVGRRKCTFDFSRR